MSKSALYGKCGGCGHVFVVAHLPMEMGKFVGLAKRAGCPKCAATSKSIMVASAEDIAAAKLAGGGE